MITELPVWTKVDPNNDVWQTLRPMHNFGIFCFIVINILKLVLVIFLCKANSSAQNPGVSP